MTLSSLRDTWQWRSALARLKRPIWPLVNLLEILSLTGGFGEVDALINELPEQIEMEHGAYTAPPRLLAPYKDLLAALLGLEGTFDVNVNSGPDKLPLFQAREAYFKQKIIERELESINSLLCSPVGCTLCCIGPRDEENNLFFEIPLAPDETRLFDVESTSTPESHDTNPYREPPLLVGNLPFYEQTPRIIYWSHGPSLILGRGTKCPHLTVEGRCSVYDSRPNTCRRPQIFAYVVDKDRNSHGYVVENKLLAISDCPYVQELKDEIHSYASLSGLDLVITSNRA